MIRLAFYFGCVWVLDFKLHVDIMAGRETGNSTGVKAQRKEKKKGRKKTRMHIRE